MVYILGVNFGMRCNGILDHILLIHLQRRFTQLDLHLHPDITLSIQVLNVALGAFHCCPSSNHVYKDLFMKR